MRVSTSPVHNSACTDIKESAVGVCAEIAKLQRVLGKTTLENEILKEAVRYAAEKSGLRSPVHDLPGRGEAGPMAAAIAHPATMPGCSPNCASKLPTCPAMATDGPVPW